MNDFPEVQSLWRESAIGTGVRELTNIWQSAWTNSTARRVVTGTAANLAGVDSRERIRYIALTLATAGITMALLRSIATPYAAPGIPRAAIAFASLLFGIVAAVPGPFARAWDQSLPARVWSALEGILYKPVE
jgi:hypothetical protein